MAEEAVKSVPTAEKTDRKRRRTRRPASPRVVVNVTREIIDSAEKRDSGHCMIAQAVKAAFPGALSVSVDLQTIRFSDPDKRLRYTYLTPRPAQIALVSFDQGLHTDPFAVTLRGAQVTKMGEPFAPRTASRSTPPMPEGERTELRAHGNYEHSVPEKVGGRTPPVGALSNTSYRGKRRAFGLRGLHF